MITFIRSFLHYLSPYRGQGVIVFLVLLLEMVVTVLIPLAFKLLIDVILPNRDMGLLGVITAAMAAAVIIVTVAGVARDRIYSRLTSLMLGDIRADVFRHLQRLSLDFFSKTRPGDVLARFSSDLSSVEAALVATTWGVMPLFEIVLTTGLLFALDWRLALLAMLVWPLALAGPWFLSPRSAHVAYQRKQREGALLSTVQQHMGAPSLIKAFGLEGWSQTIFQGQNRDLRDTTSRAAFLAALIERTARTGILILWVALFAAGAWLTFSGVTTIGTLAAFQALFLSLSYAIDGVVEFAPYTVQANGGLRRIEEILDSEPSVADAPGSAPLPPVAKSIEFRDVDFSYSGTRPHVADVSLSIPHGTSAALVGSSGSGKSTVLSLLLRFYQPQKGAILVDGHDLRSVTAASWRGQIGTVFQQPLLFDESIGENIRTGRPDASDSDVQAAAELVGLAPLLSRLPEGLDAPVGDQGSSLSGGQRQRVAVARALIRDPAVLVLDEATSAQDPATEADLNELFSELKKGRTLISVTHRLASVKDFDRVFVLEEGAVVEEGSHDTLLAQGGRYAELWQKQNGVVVEEKLDRVRIEPAWLRRVPLLETLPDQVLEEVAAAFVPERYEAGQAIVHEGDEGVRFYVIVRGTVDVERAVPTEAEPQRIAVLEDGDFFGEIALLKSRPRNATVRATSSTTCISLSQERFLGLLGRFPKVREEVTHIADLRTEAPDIG